MHHLLGWMLGGRSSGGGGGSGSNSQQSTPSKQTLPRPPHSHALTPQHQTAQRRPPVSAPASAPWRSFDAHDGGRDGRDRDGGEVRYQHTQQHSYHSSQQHHHHETTSRVYHPPPPLHPPAAAGYSSAAISASASYRSAPSSASGPSRRYPSPPHRGGSIGGNYRGRGETDHHNRSRSRSARAYRDREREGRYEGGGGGGGGGGSSSHHSSQHHHDSHHDSSRRARHSSRSSSADSRSSSRSDRGSKRRNNGGSGGGGAGSSSNGHNNNSSSHRRRSASSSASSSRSRSRSGGSGSDRSRSGSGSGSGSGDESSDDGNDEDKEGLIDIKTGELIKNRYEVLSVAGQGTFGTVLDVYDTQTHTRLALKVVRSVPRYLDAAQVEVDILTKIQRADPAGKSLCVRFDKQFSIMHNGQQHVCLGFEKLGRSLYDFIKKNHYRGFSVENVARFGYQLLTSVAFCHSIHLIHTDLKPENILLRKSDYRVVKEYSRYRDEAMEKKRLAEQKKAAKKNGAAGGAAAAGGAGAAASSSASKRNGVSKSPAAAASAASAGAAADGSDSSSDDDADASSSTHAKSDAEYREPLDSSIRLIDFGGATFEHEYHSRIVNTRQYRAPEVVLGLGWSYPSDLWSIGAILPELFTGELLFGTHEDLEHVALMEKILEQPLPRSITSKAVAPYVAEQHRRVGREGAAAWGDLAASPEAFGYKSDSEESGSTDRSKRSASHKRERSSSAPRADLLLHLSSGRLRWPEGARSANSLKTVKRARTLRQLLPDAQFLDLTQRLLTFDPAQRITAKEALAHPFFDRIRHEFDANAPKPKAAAAAAPTQAQAASASSSSSSSAAAAAAASSSHRDHRDRGGDDRHHGGGRGSSPDNRDHHRSTAHHSGGGGHHHHHSSHHDSDAHHKRKRGDSHDQAAAAPSSAAAASSSRRSSHAAAPHSSSSHQGDSYSSRGRRHGDADDDRSTNSKRRR